jgi:hypothetical protein
MIVLSEVDSQGASIPIRGCTCTVSRTRELDERLRAVNARAIELTGALLLLNRTGTV